MVNNDTHISGHSPVILNIGGKLSEEMGSRIKILVDVRGIARKDARMSSPTKGKYVMKGKSLNQTWKHWNESSEDFLAQIEGKTGEEYYGRGKPIQSAKNTISAPQDKSDGSAITSELRAQQNKFSRMKKYNILVRKGKEHSVEGLRLKEVVSDCFMEDITKQEDVIRGNKSAGPLIVIPGGSAQIADRLKEAEKAWGGLWAVEAEDLPEFENQPMELIIEDETRRVVNRLVDGKAKGVDGWSPAEFRALSRTHIQGLADLLNLIEREQKWPDDLNPIIARIPEEGAGSEGQLRPIAILPYIYR
eukprot:7088377-Heterocapsa_arctica.AAC.1